jgi:uncharacterized SAM-dependent methyltransferase
VAVDISEAFLNEAVAGMRLAFPSMTIDAIAADLTTNIVLTVSVSAHRRPLFHPGSSIGNFDPPQAQALLSRMCGLLQDDGALLIGVDLLKDAAVLDAAYDDESFIRNVSEKVDKRGSRGTPDLTKFLMRIRDLGLHDKVVIYVTL